jgi:DNA-binding CsgD family transcriptional regulator
MKFDPCIRKPWIIPQDIERFYSLEKVEQTLGFFNRACNGNFYMFDYHKQRVIMGSSVNRTLTGYSKSTIEKENFKIYYRILKSDELRWLVNMKKQVFDVFFSYPESERQDLEITYDVIAQTSYHHEIILRHKLVPYQLCNNGNLWMALCFITSISYLPMHHKATIVNTRTGEAYNYFKDAFVLCEKTGALTSEEVRILELLSEDESSKSICELLNISESYFKKKKKKIFNKLKVQSLGAAVHQAHLLKYL